MKKIQLVLLLLLTATAVQAQKPTKPTVLSVADLLPNYELDTALVNDTAYAVNYLAQQPQDYVALTNLCVSIRTKAQQVIASLENDYTMRDSLVWIDSNIVLGDYAVYEYRLRRLADLMGRMSIRYSRLEQQRVEAEKETARLRAEEEARRQQEERDSLAAALKLNIENHHRTIIETCDGAGVTDKARLKWLKDLYYSYLMVYNKYDLSATRATLESIAQLEELNGFQNDLMENVLGENSLPFQIDNFKNVLKQRCDKKDSDIFRSYSRLFKQTSVPVAFADIHEYQDYILRMQTIINVQSRYIKTIELRDTINKENDAIVQLYGKKYRDAANSYKDVMRSINLVPAFTTNSESLNFIQELEDFIVAQQRYQSQYATLETITHRSDSIICRSESSFRDVTRAYKEVWQTLVPLPAFKDSVGAVQYENELDEVLQVQQAWLSSIELRERIQVYDDSITILRKSDRTLWNGYRLLRKQAELTPNFSTVERGNAFLASLRSHIEMQQTCLAIIAKRQTIVSNAERINTKASSFRNILKAYSRLEKVYDDFDDITNYDELRRYSRQCDQTIQMQEKFFNALTGDYIADIDAKLKRVSEVDKIKLIVGMSD